MALRIKKQKQLDTVKTIQRIKAGDEGLLSSIYEMYRKDFLKFGHRYLKDETQILDVYQDAFVAFYENIKNDKVAELKSTIKTYIFSIGKYMLIHKFKDDIKQVNSDDIDGFEFVDVSMDREETNSHLQETMQAALSKLNDKCKQLLVLFYYRKYAMESIVENMGYKNANVAKNQKKRCMQYLREIMQKKNDE